MEQPCIALPVNDIETGYAYPPRVRFELTEKDIDSYRRAADFLNINNVDLVCLQHEYGIFGDTLHLYYGVADTGIALATGSVGAMLEWLEQHG
jgi:hypothetical protein